MTEDEAKENYPKAAAAVMCMELGETSDGITGSMAIQILFKKWKSLDKVIDILAKSFLEEAVKINKMNGYLLAIEFKTVDFRRYVGGKLGMM